MNAFFPQLPLENIYTINSDMPTT